MKYASAAVAAATLGPCVVANAFVHTARVSPTYAVGRSGSDNKLHSSSFSYLESISASESSSKRQQSSSSSAAPSANGASEPNSSYLDSLSSAYGSHRTSSSGPGITTYLDAISRRQNSASASYLPADTSPYLSAMSEACDADEEPTVECADAITNYLDVVIENDAVSSEEVNRSTDASVQTSSSYHFDVFDNLDTTATRRASATISPEEEELQDKFLKMVSTEVEVKRLLGQNPYALTDIPLGVMVGRFLDNVEDSAQINNGKKKGKSRLKRKDQPAEERPTVVVLGTGWAAHAFIKLASTYDLRIVVVSPVNHFVFTPMLASAAVGTVEYRSMTEPIRVTNPYIDNYVEGRAIGIDVQGKKVVVQLTSLSTATGTFKGIAANDKCRLELDPFPAEDSECATAVIELNYDYLLCAVGTSVRSSIVPGAKEHCFNLKTSQDSKRLRTAIGESLEFASRPDVQESYYIDPEQKEMAKQERRRRVRFFIVGGGPTGVELAGEMSDFISQVCGGDGAFQHLADDISVTLVHGGSELLPAMDQDLRQLALAAMELQGVDVRLNTRLKEVGRDFVTLGEKGSDAVETIPVGLTVWAAGNAPVPFVQELLSQLPENAAGSAGRINVDRWLRCPTPTPETFGSILVLGDAACLVAERGEYESSEDLPQTAQVAGQQGAFAARMLNRGYDLRKTPPRLKDEAEYSEQMSLLRTWLIARGLEESPEFTFLSLGLLAYIGGGEALNQVELGPVPIFNYAGKIAFALWRSVYLSKQAATRNQALIAFDWLRTEAFGRDITRL